MSHLEYHQYSSAGLTALSETYRFSHTSPECLKFCFAHILLHIHVSGKNTFAISGGLWRARCRWGQCKFLQWSCRIRWDFRRRHDIHGKKFIKRNSIIEVYSCFHTVPDSDRSGWRFRTLVSDQINWYGFRRVMYITVYVLYAGEYTSMKACKRESYERR